VHDDHVLWWSKRSVCNSVQGVEAGVLYKRCNSAV
jgi:hypothetical protein